MSSSAVKTIYLKTLWILFCIAFVWPLVVYPSLPLGPNSFYYGYGHRAALQSAVYLVPLCLSLVMWAYAVLKGWLKLYFHTAYYVVLAVWVCMIIATVVSPFGVQTFFGDPIEEMGLLMWTLLLVGMVFTTQLVVTKEKLVQLLGCISIVGALIALAALLEIGGIRPFAVVNVRAWLFTRGAATLENPDMLGTFLVIPAIFSLGLIFFERQRWLRVLWVTTAFICALSLLFTQSRGAWVAYLFAVLSFVAVIGWVRKPTGMSKKTFTLSGFVFLAGLLLLLFTRGETVARIKDAFILTGPTALGGRLGYWMSMVPVALRRPFFGWGPGTTTPLWERYAAQQTAHLAPVANALESMHNLYLEVALHFGFITMLIFLIGLIALIVAGVRKMRTSSLDDETSWLPITVLIALAAYCLIALSAKFIVPLYVVFALLVGLGISLFTQRRVIAQPLAKNATILLLVAVVLVGGYFGFRGGVSAFVSATRGPYTNVEKLEKVVRAWHWAPWRPDTRRKLAIGLANGLSDEEYRMVGLTRQQVEEVVIAEAQHDPHMAHDMSTYLRSFNDDANGALEWADLSLELRPGFAFGFLARARALEALGRIDEAHEYAQKAVEAEKAHLPHEQAGTIIWTQAIVLLWENGFAEEAAAYLAELRVRYPHSEGVAYLENLMDAGIPR